MGIISSKHVSPDTELTTGISEIYSNGFGSFSSKHRIDLIMMIFLALMSYASMIIVVIHLRILNKSLLGWDNYLVDTSIRVKALLDKAGMSNSEQKEFIYSIPSMAVGKKREIRKHKEGGHPELHTAVVEMALLDRNPQK